MLVFPESQLGFVLSLCDKICAKPSFRFGLSLADIDTPTLWNLRAFYKSKLNQIQIWFHLTRFQKISLCTKIILVYFSVTWFIGHVLKPDYVSWHLYHLF